MGFRDYFKPVRSMTADEAREFMKGRDVSEVNLVDVRQPKEYERGHIPGARLLPVGQIHERFHELDPHKSTITYCGSGVRSRAAAAILADNGFEQAFTMEGGIRAWEGLVARGVPDSGTAYFPASATPETLIGLSWVLEEGSRKFYTAIPDLTTDEETQELFGSLARAEEHHKDSLLGLFRNISGKESDDAFPRSVLPGDVPEDVMEGGMSVSEALRWVRDKDAGSILELSISLETHAYDLYLKMHQRMKDSRSQQVFYLLATEEKRHLDKLTLLLEKKM